MTFMDEPPDPYQASWLAVPTGLSETLFRLNEDLKPEPWLSNGKIRWPKDHVLQPGSGRFVLLVNFDMFPNY